VYNKVVRDKVPHIMSSEGFKCEIRVLPDNQFLIELEKKLNEEIKEYLKDRSLEELIDMLEVIYKIAELRGVDSVELASLRKAKQIAKGKFDKNLFLIESDEGG